MAESRGNTPGSIASEQLSETPSSRSARQPNGEPVSEELSAIREGLHDLENKLDRIESEIVHAVSQPAEPTRARLIDFVSSGPPLTVSPSIKAESSQTQIPPASQQASALPAQFFPATQSPWLRDFNKAASHPSQERFGIEEATVAELVEFFESEKKCSVEPGGKPCDHCAMCSSRGF